MLYSCWSTLETFTVNFSNYNFTYIISFAIIHMYVYELVKDTFGTEIQTFYKLLLYLTLSIMDRLTKTEFVISGV